MSKYAVSSYIKFSYGKSQKFSYSVSLFYFFEMLAQEKG